MELLGMTEALVSAGLCGSCFHSVRLPKFDASNLYGKEATEVRAKHFRRYFPDQTYGATSSNYDIGAAFTGASREYKRFNRNTRWLGGYMRGIERQGGSLKILDWGGGDGSVSGHYAQILASVTGKLVESWVFDYADWGHSSANRLNDETVTEKAPFDMAVLSHVIEHTHDPVALLSRIHGLLRDGGIVVVEAPDERTNIFRALPGRPITLHYHVAWFSARSLARALGTAGFTRQFTRYHFDSSYHGSPLTAIFGVAQKNPDDKNPAGGRFPSLVSEAFSLPWLAIRKILVKILQKSSAGR